LEFSYEVLDQMSAAYQKLLKRVGELKEEGAVDEAAFADFRKKFTDALTDDINTSMAITILYDVLKADINDATKRALVASFDEVLSLDLLEGAKKLAQDDGVDAETEAWILERIEARKAAKKAKDFAQADAIREELKEKGIAIEDTREGTKWKKM
jgi:cysteinyl-tRNA synthetase